MTQTVSALYDDHADARQAVSDLKTAGVPERDISLVANDAHGEHAGDRGDAAADDAGKGAGIGAAVGGLGGLLAGLGVLAIPGLGPVVAVGWLASTAVGALAGSAVGAAAGGIVGALTGAGVSEDDAHVYAEGVRRGGTLVSARVPDDMASAVREMLARRNVDLGARRQAYATEGWTRFNPAAPAYSPEQVAAERARYVAR